MRTLEEFIRPTQKELFKKLRKMYRGKTTICPNSYILVKGDAPVMLLAHLDTVHKEPVHNICTTEEGNILMSPQGIGGDDRCGVYALASIYEMSEIKPWLLFTCDEEIGGVGASVFCKNHANGKTPKLDELKFLIEIDRKGEKDAVYYDCENDEFEAYITNKGFKTEWGSFSDISLVAPELGVAAVNLSSGYYNAHTLHEYINRSQIDETIRKAVEIVAESVSDDIPKFEYVEASRYFDSLGYYFGCRYSMDFDEPALKKVPENIRRQYAELLDYYSEEELEDLRKEHGDQVIDMLFESEFGCKFQDYLDYEEDWK